MEEDIDILEDFIEDEGLYELYRTSHIDLIRKALENLIKGYRELEEKNKNLYDLGKAFANNQLKIKMRNKIDELKKKYELADNYWQYDYDVDMNTIQVLQELLEDK